MKFFLFALVFPLSISICAQVNYDKIFVNGKIIECIVTEITPEAVKFSYPNESMLNTIYKNSIEKIIFRSGRVEVFSESTSFKTVKSGYDWESVSVTRLEGEVKGLFKLGSVSSKAKGTTTLANMNKVKDRAMKKLKIQAAMMGGNIIYITQQETVGNQMGTEYHAGRPTETNYAGIAYTNKLPGFDEFKKLMQQKEHFTFFTKEFLGNNSLDLETMEPQANMVSIDKIENEKGLIYAYATIPGEKTNRFRVSYFDNEFVVLLYRDKRKIYNLVLKI